MNEDYKKVVSTILDEVVLELIDSKLHDIYSLQKEILELKKYTFPSYKQDQQIYKLTTEICPYIASLVLRGYQLDKLTQMMRNVYPLPDQVELERAEYLKQILED